MIENRENTMIKRKSFFAFGFVLILTGLASAQVRTVTNSDLERYRQKRVQGNQQLRENYARMGFPAPDELARRNESEIRAAIDLAARLKAERLEQTRLEQERRNAQYWASVVAANQRPTIIVVESANPGYVVPYGFGDFGFGYGNGFRRRGYTSTQQGYYAGGQFWPVGSQTPPAPMFRRR